jgi:hypothetical protein
MTDNYIKVRKCSIWYINIQNCDRRCFPLFSVYMFHKRMHKTNPKFYYQLDTVLLFVTLTVTATRNTCMYSPQISTCFVHLHPRTPFHPPTCCQPRTTRHIPAELPQPYLSPENILKYVYSVAPTYIFDYSQQKHKGNVFPFAEGFKVTVRDNRLGTLFKR